MGTHQMPRTTSIVQEEPKHLAARSSVCSVTEVKVVHAVSHQHVVQQRQAWIVVAGEKRVVSVSPVHVTFCQQTQQRHTLMYRRKEINS